MTRITILLVVYIIVRAVESFIRIAPCVSGNSRVTVKMLQEPEHGAVDSERFGQGRNHRDSDTAPAGTYQRTMQEPRAAVSVQHV